MTYILFSYCLNLGYSKDWGVVRIPDTDQYVKVAEQEAKDKVWGNYLRLLHGKTVSVKDYPDTDKAVSVNRLDETEWGKTDAVVISSEYYGA